MRFLTPFAIILGLLATLGCAHPRVVSSPESQYDSLGSLEIKLSTKRKIAPYLTLGLMRKHSYESLQGRLNKELWRQAKEFHHADAVTNVTYWPQPETDVWVDDYYARGEMIKYKRFAETEVLTPPPAAVQS